MNMQQVRAPPAGVHAPSIAHARAEQAGNYSTVDVCAVEGSATLQPKTDLQVSAGLLDPIQHILIVELDGAAKESVRAGHNM